MPHLFTMTTSVWCIQQVNDVLHFLTVNDDNIKLLWLSERSGYCHLEVVLWQKDQAKMSVI